MALLANRIKKSNKILDYTKFILIAVRRFFVFSLIIVSLFLFTTNSKKFSSISLEIVGNIIFTGLLIHENVFKQVNLISQHFIYFRNLAKENIELQLEIARLKSLQNDIETIQSENNELKRLLSLMQEKQYNYVTAKLLSVSLNPFSKTALISAGAKHGIEVDQIVTNGEALIGRVLQVSNNYSQVILITDVNSRIPITTISSKENGIMSGYNDGSKILYLPKTNFVQKGEKVVTSGHGSIYPYGITVGYVTEVDTENVLVKPIVDLSKQEFVTILLSH